MEDLEEASEPDPPVVSPPIVPSSPSSSSSPIERRAGASALDLKSITSKDGNGAKANSKSRPVTAPNDDDDADVKVS